MNIIDAHIHLYPKPILKKDCHISQEHVKDFTKKIRTCLRGISVDFSERL